MSSSDDSDEDESIARFKEALDVRFLDDSMYSDTKKSHKKTEEVPKLLPSKRPVERQNNPCSFLKVTPEFQSYVSKQLSELLDKRIKEISKKENISCTSCDSREESGIYLLSSSKKFLSSKESNEVIVPSKRPKFKRRTEENIVDFSEVVVSPEWVLNQEGTKGWQKNIKKSILYSYKKKNNGTLEFVNESS